MKRYSWMMMAVVILLVGLISLDAQANKKQPGTRNHAFMGRFRAEMPLFHNWLAKKEELKLTDQQIANLKKKGYEFEKAMIDIRAALEKEELEMRHLMDNDKLTKEQALAQQKKIQQIRNDMDNKRLILRFDLEAELTAEQKDKLESMRCGKGDLDGGPGCGGMHRFMDHPNQPGESGRPGMPGRPDKPGSKCPMNQEDEPDQEPSQP